MALLWLPLQAFGLATPAATRLMQLGPALQGCMLLQDITSWEVLQKTVETQFADISGSAVVAPSPRHGLGLYASTDLAKDTVASFYPIHSLGLEDQRLTYDPKDAAADNWESSAEYRAQVLHPQVQEQAPGVYVDVNLKRAEVSGWLAHRVNDAAVCAGASEAEILEYLETCRQECNCALVPFGTAQPIMALYTTRDVSQGDELLICYGHSFWIEQAGGKVAADEPPTEAVARAGTQVMWGDDDFEGRQAKLVERYRAEIALFERVLAMCMSTK